MCERRTGGVIGEDEAHYVCAILNAPIVGRFIIASSDERSYKIRPPIYVPVYNPSDKLHAALVAASRTAHEEPLRAVAIRKTLDATYLAICEKRPKFTAKDEDRRDAETAREKLRAIDANPSRLITGEKLKAILDELVS